MDSLATYLRDARFAQEMLRKDYQLKSNILVLYPIELMDNWISNAKHSPRVQTHVSFLLI